MCSIVCGANRDIEYRGIDLKKRHSVEWRIRPLRATGHKQPWTTLCFGVSVDYPKRIINACNRCNGNATCTLSLSTKHDLRPSRRHTTKAYTR